jgi:DNA-binding transcriptional MerR regulator
MKEGNYMYKINEVSEMTNIPSHTLRYYEKEGIIPTIDRDSGGRRVYTDENIKWIEIVICLKETNMPIVEIKEIVKLSIIGDSTIEKRKEILEKHRKRVEEELNSIKKNLKKIDKKIDFYNGAKEC